MALQTCWGCVQFPHLALNQLALQGGSSAAPLVILDAADRVHDANRAARRAGVGPGMMLPEALACLTVTPRILRWSDLGGEALLDPLVVLVHRYSDRIVPEAAASRILFEACGSRRLFGGLAALRHSLLHDFETLGYAARCSIAATPAMARLAASLTRRQRMRLFGVAAPGDEHAVCAGFEFRDAPAELSDEAADSGWARVPIVAIESLRPYAERLHAVDIRRLGALLRLPRTDLAHRHGPDCVAAIERFLGERPEPLPRWQPVPSWEMRLALADVEHVMALRFPLQRMLQHLQAALDAQAAQVRRLSLDLLLCAGAADTDPETVTIVLESARPTARAENWMKLWRVRLERVRLSAPVRECRLRATALESALPGSQPLPFAPADRGNHAARLSPAVTATGFGIGQAHGKRPDDGCGASHAFRHAPGQDWGEAVAVLRARLGDAAVYRLGLSGFSVPEQALECRFWGPAMAESRVPFRSPLGSPWWTALFGTPLWILPHDPMRLAAATVEGSELADEVVLGRLEGGWWSPGGDVRRDYFIRKLANGRRAWIFRDLRRHQLWMQGYWG